MYNYGDKILVSLLPTKEFEPRIFIHMDEKNRAVCVYEKHAKRFINNEPFDTCVFANHKPLSDKYNHVEMIGKKLHLKHTEVYVVIVKTDPYHFSFIDKDAITSNTWEELDKFFEVMD